MLQAIPKSKAKTMDAVRVVLMSIVVLLRCTGAMRGRGAVSGECDATVERGKAAVLGCE
jgi:hypothetical protein